MRQQKQKHECPNCGGALKRVIGAQSRMKFWQCLRGPGCFRKPVSELGTETVTLDVQWKTDHVQA